MQKQIATGVLAGALVIAGAGATLVLPNLVAAADPAASPSATTTPPTVSPGTAGNDTDPGRGRMVRHGGPGGPAPAASPTTSGSTNG